MLVFGLSSLEFPCADLFQLNSLAPSLPGTVTGPSTGPVGPAVQTPSPVVSWGTKGTADPLTKPEAGLAQSPVPEWLLHKL